MEHKHSIFSHSYIAACINIRLGLKWKSSANFSIQAREDKWQNRKGTILGAEEIKTHLKWIALQKLLLPLHAPCKPCWEAMSEEQSAALGTLVTGRGVWGGSGWAVAAWPMCSFRGVCSKCVAASRAATAREPNAVLLQRASRCKKWCSQNSRTFRELSKMRKKQLSRKEVQGRCWFSLASSAMSLHGLQFAYFEQSSLHESQLRRAVSLCLGCLLVYTCSSMGCSATMLAFRLPPRQVSVGVHPMSERWVQKVPWVPV